MIEAVSDPLARSGIWEVVIEGTAPILAMSESTSHTLEVFMEDSGEVEESCRYELAELSEQQDELDCTRLLARIAKATQKHVNEKRFTRFLRRWRKLLRHNKHRQEMGYGRQTEDREAQRHLLESALGLIDELVGQQPNLPNHASLLALREELAHLLQITLQDVPRPRIV